MLHGDKKSSEIPKSSFTTGSFIRSGIKNIFMYDVAILLAILIFKRIHKLKSIASDKDLKTEVVTKQKPDSFFRFHLCSFHSAS